MAAIYGLAVPKELAEHLVGRTPKGTIPVSVAKLMLSAAPIRKWLQVEKEALDYFTYDSSYDTFVAEADLKAANIVCPDLLTTLQPMITYYRKYKDDSDKQIGII